MAITIKNPASMRTLVGSWTQTAGSANQTMTVAGTVWDARFSEDKSSGTVDYRVGWSQSVSGRITTITIHCDATVTNGKFIIFYTPN